MIEAVLLVKPAQSWIQRVAAKYPAKIRILDCKASEGSEGVEELFEIIVDEDYSAHLIKDLQEDSYISQVEIIDSKDGRISGSVRTHRCTACRSLAESNCFLVSVSTSPEGSVEWNILGSNDAFRQLLKKLEKQGVETSVKNLSKARDEKPLTARQEEILQIALEKGYYDYPKRIDLRALASLLDVSPPTLSELLRKGEKKVLRAHFRGRVSALSRQNRL